MIRGVHHIAIVTDDLEVMTRFYCDILGGTIAFESHWKVGSPKIDAIIGVSGTSATLTMVRLGNAYIELFKYHEPESARRDGEPVVWQKGLRHICFDVVDVEAEYERLRTVGVHFDGTLQTAALARTVYGRDPEGNILEFQETLGAGPFLLPEFVSIEPDSLTAD
ncbi:VOC family protein [soil metagenome]